MRRVRPLPFLAVCTVMTVAAACWLLVKATYVPGSPSQLTIGAALTAIATGLGLADGAPAAHVAIVYEIRLPRVLVAVFAGYSLAIAGTVMQAVFRNPLASPEVIGTAAGSAFGAALAIALGFASATVLALPAFAFLGGVAVSAIVFAAASGPGGTSITGILLAGMAMNSLLGAATAFVVTLSLGGWERNAEILQWIMGGLDKCNMDNARIVGAGLLLFAAALVPMVRDMDLLTLRDESANSLGIDADRLRKVLLVIACGITATAVSSTGGIAFVGLVVPHIVRLMVGPAHRALLPCAGAMGALVLVVSDAVCQVAGAEANLRIGVVTAVLGAPFFLYLLARHRRGYAL